MSANSNSDNFWYGEIFSLIDNVQKKFPQQSEEVTQFLKLFAGGYTKASLNFFRESLQLWGERDTPMSSKELLDMANKLLKM